MKTETIQIDAPGGNMPGFLATPDGPAARPAILVLMEAFGLLPSIESVCRRFAEAGFVALAPDLYYREAPDNKAAYDDLPRAMELMGKLIAGGDQCVHDIAAALDHLERQSTVESGTLGVIGFCMGGALTFRSACALSDRIAAAAPFYGGGIVNQLDHAANIKCPIYLFFGDRDSFIPLDQVNRIDATLRTLGTDYRLKVYPGADHGFFCEDRSAVYHPEAAADAWREVRDFFAEHLARD